MAKTKSAGSTRLGRDSQPKYLGVKLFEGQPAKVGSIIIRQRGARFLPGLNTKMGRDYTIFAVKEGIVRFENRVKTRFDGSKRLVKTVNVIAPETFSKSKPQTKSKSKK
jgi:large subunit ribosomal protein L27